MRKWPSVFVFHSDFICSAVVLYNSTDVSGGPVTITRITFLTLFASNPRRLLLRFDTARRKPPEATRRPAGISQKILLAPLRCHATTHCSLVRPAPTPTPTHQCRYSDTIDGRFRAQRSLLSSSHLTDRRFFCKPGPLVILYVNNCGAIVLLIR